MKLDEIAALAKIMKENDLTALEINEEGKKIKLGREVTAVVAPPAKTQPQVLASAETVFTPDSALQQGVVSSPIVGVYYEAPSPGADAFVKIGDSVKKGDVLCIVEAMKNMNEILSEYDGKVLEIYTGNGQLVEVGQRLMRIGENE